MMSFPDQRSFPEQRSFPDQIGKLPRSAESIRKSLQAIQQRAPTDVTTGPRPGGMLPFDSVVIAEFADKAALHRCQNALSAAGIFSSSERRGKRLILSVDCRDQHAASEIEAHLRLREPARRSTGFRRDFDCLILGSVLGASLGLSLVFITRHAAMTFFALALTLLGAMVGNLADRQRTSVARRGAGFRIEIYDCLLTMAVVGLVLSLPRIIQLITR